MPLAKQHALPSHHLSPQTQLELVHAGGDEGPGVLVGGSDHEALHRASKRQAQNLRGPIHHLQRRMSQLGILRALQHSTLRSPGAPLGRAHAQEHTGQEQQQWNGPRH